MESVRRTRRSRKKKCASHERWGMWAPWEDVGTRRTWPAGTARARAWSAARAVRERAESVPREGERAHETRRVREAVHAGTRGGARRAAAASRRPLP